MSAWATTPRALLAPPAQPTHLDSSDPIESVEPCAEVVPLALLESIRPLAIARFEPPPPPSAARLVVNRDTPDDALALAACQGDPRAAVTIWRRYGTQVRTKLLRWIGTHDLDDLVQEVFSRLFEQLPRLRQPGSLRSFLIGITVRVACTELRRRRRWRLRLTATGELPEIADQIINDGSGRQALSRFEVILGKLAPRTRRVFVLRYVEKLELVDVAAAMDISLATAKRHLGRASTRVFAMAAREPALAEYTRRLKLNSSTAGAKTARTSNEDLY